MSVIHSHGSLRRPRVVNDERPSDKRCTVVLLTRLWNEVPRAPGISPSVCLLTRQG